MQQTGTTLNYRMTVVKCEAGGTGLIQQ